ncbi:MAG: hypothetical protein ACTHXA_15005 [Gulosibacter sp.]|uniref:hypothetical protein n=1 Tax=Gulosibacter sp. TaxID=2817531 RepID=UPI003F92B2A4
MSGEEVIRDRTSRAAAWQALDELVRASRVGAKHTTWTVTAWLNHWVDTIADLTPETRRGYESSIRAYLKPHVGRHKLTELRPEHLERLYAAMRDGTYRKARKKQDDTLDKPRPLSASTIHQAHAIISRALKIAHQRGLTIANVTLMVEPPKAGRAKTTTMSVADARRVLEQAVTSGEGARWALALMCGVRPAEALGSHGIPSTATRSTSAGSCNR